MKAICRRVSAQLEKTCERDVQEFRQLCGAPSNSPSREFSWPDFRLEIAEYGQLLQCWPEIFQAARELRADGIRISEPLRDL
ncbi:MAG TPA: hypothetical protein VNF74_03375 [Terriglobales bacterium]|nr:hypothetical protein [Terriglobales bacterium]